MKVLGSHGNRHLSSSFVVCQPSPPGFEYNSDGFVRAMSCVPASLDAQKGGSTGACFFFFKDGTNTLKPWELQIIYILLMEEILHHLGCIKPGK